MPKKQSPEKPTPSPSCSPPWPWRTASRNEADWPSPTSSNSSGHCARRPSPSTAPARPSRPTSPKPNAPSSPAWASKWLTKPNVLTRVGPHDLHRGRPGGGLHRADVGHPGSLRPKISAQISDSSPLKPQLTALSVHHRGIIDKSQVSRARTLSRKASSPPAPPEATVRDHGHTVPLKGALQEIQAAIRSGSRQRLPQPLSWSTSCGSSQKRSTR